MIVHLALRTGNTACGRFITLTAYTPDYNKQPPIWNFGRPAMRGSFTHNPAEVTCNGCKRTRLYRKAYSALKEDS